jgi:hypothetical protein
MQATPPETARSVFPHVVKQTRREHDDEHDVACEPEDLVVHFERLRVAKRKYEDSEVDSSRKHRREGPLTQDVLPAEELWSHNDFDWIEQRGRTAYIGTSHDSTRRGPVLLKTTRAKILPPTARHLEWMKQTNSTLNLIEIEY